METSYKYGRTPHLPWSPGFTSDDRVLQSVDHFSGREVVITQKMDGENTTIYSDHFHARSVDSKNHPSRTWLKMWHPTIKDNIPTGYRICGEYLYAKHSLHYTDLESYFLGFSMWEGERCFSWDETMEWFSMIPIIPVKVYYRGPWDEICGELPYIRWENEQEVPYEGYVVRLADEFHRKDFGMSIAKWVRKGHVQTEEHWMNQQVVPNRLRGAV